MTADVLAQFPHPRPASWPELNLDALDQTLGHVFDLAGKAAAEAGRMLDEDLDDLAVPGWDQTVYRNGCGTAFCVAGWRAKQDGCRWNHDSLSVRVGDELVWIDQYACDRFGFVPQEGVALFSPDNDLSDLRAFHAALHAGRDIMRRVA